MTTLTREEIQKLEEYYYLIGYKSWAPFPEELKVKLLSKYGEAPLPYNWHEQDIDEGVRKMIIQYFTSTL